MNHQGYTPTTERAASVIPNGRYPARIGETMEAVAGGYSCVKVQIICKKHEGESPDTYTIFDRPTDPKKASYWDYDMTKFFDAFGIQRGDFDISHWRGRMGYVDVFKKWNANKGKAYAQIVPVMMDDPPTQDYIPQGAEQHPQGDLSAQAYGGAPQQQGGFAGVTQVTGSDGFPEDIPF